MEQKLSDTLVKAIDRSNPMMQNLQLASRFNKLIDEGGGGGADLEDDHATTIDVSAYTEPVEVTPAEGKDGMKKNTITLSNIPQAGATLYAWVAMQSLYVYTLSATPSVGDDVYGGDPSDYSSIIQKVVGAITAVGENDITVADTTGFIIPNTYTRDSTRNIVLQAGEGGSVTVEALNVTENGTYTAPAGKAYSPVTVNVPSGGDTTGFSVQCLPLANDYVTCVEFPRSTKVTAVTCDSGLIIAGGVQKGYAVFDYAVDGGTKVSVVYDGDTYSYTYADRDYESHELVKENP